MKKVSLTLASLLLCSQLAFADTCEEQLNHTLVQNNMVARIVSQYQKLLTEVKVVSIDHYEHSLNSVNPDLIGCPIEVSALATIKIAFDHLKPWVSIFKVKRVSKVEVHAERPVITYEVDSLGDECPHCLK